MGYLVCQNCGGYYKLKKDESAEDFVACQCYGQLVYVESLEDIPKEDAKDKLAQKLDSRFKEKMDHEFEYISVDEDFKPETEDKTETKEDIPVEIDSDPVVKEPNVKNRAYYRRYEYYSEPDIDYLKNLKDVTGLINALYYDDMDIQLKSVQALAVVGDDRAINHLNKLAKKEGGSLKLYAEIAIKQIRSRKHGYKSLNRENYRQIPSESTQSHDPHKKIPNDSLNVVSKDAVNSDDVSSGVVSKDVVNSDDVSSDSLKTEFQDIHDEMDHTGVDKKDLSQHKYEKDLNQVDEEKIHQEKIQKSTPAGSLTKEPFTEEIPEKSSFDEHKTSLKDEINSSKLKIPLNKSVESEDIVTSPPIETARVKKSETQSTDSGSVEAEIPPVEYIKISEIKSEIKNLEELSTSPPENLNDKLFETYKPSKKVSPEIKLISDSNTSFKKVPKDLSDKTIPVTIKTVDDTFLSSKNSKFEKPSPVSIPDTVDFKKMDNTNKNEKDDYSGSWFDLKNADKQIIGFIILFSIIMVVGVVLTMTQMKS
ncbi:MAG TPA: hypothetical protein GX531_03275 [Methanothermobacter sp.]|nr:hypothetical protein [Methanothermobacter sp.]